MNELKLLAEIKRDVEHANSLRRNVTWKNWQATDIFEAYNITSNAVKTIIRRAIKTDGASLDNYIKKLEKSESK